MIMPIPGMLLMSIGEKRIDKNTSQTAAQIARQDIDAVRNDVLTMSWVRFSGKGVRERLSDTF
jgi:hypothetical protein